MPIRGLILFLFSSILLGCLVSSESDILPDNGIYGSWSFKESQDEFIIYERSAKLPDQNYGLTIKDNHSVIERNIEGFCGTPPVIYTNYTGEWSAEEENELMVRVDGYWNGTQKYKLLIIEVTSVHLKVKKELL